MGTAVNRWDAVRDVATLQDEVERMFRQAFGARGEATSSAGAWSPALDVEETEDGFVLHVELPGVTADDVEVSLEEDVLTIAGQRDFYGAKTADGFRRIERRFGRFHRAVRLPDRVAADEVEASYRDGLLTVTVPKAEEAKPRRIAVKTG
jgi:HSP20 family protein